MKSTTVIGLLDADIITHQYSAAAQRIIKWDEETTSIEQTMSDGEIIRKARDEIVATRDLLKLDRVILCFSSLEGNFRKTVLPSYKGNRKGVDKPVKFHWLREKLHEKYETFERPMLEGDDVMGILSTHPKLLPGKKIIVSIDKDMKTIPGWLFNPDKDKEPWLVEGIDADYYHMFQTLTGDTTDGYKGCPNIGKVKAEAMLLAAIEAGDPMWKPVVEAYEKAGLTEEDALVQARCARILRHTDYDYKRKQVKLWSPK